MTTKKYIKTRCNKTGKFGLITVEPSNGVDTITNFYGIDEETAKSIDAPYDGALPRVSSKLKPCASCNGRTPMCCDMSKQCPVGKGELMYQCLYCKAMEFTCSSALDIYFLMDESGSMGDRDRREASKAVRNLVQSLQDQGNTYSFVAWGSNAGYIFRNETQLSKMDYALKSYEDDTTGYGGGTDAANALATVMSDVLNSKKKVCVILVTDGAFDSESAALEMRGRLLANKNADILAIGVTGANESTLKKMGTVDKFSKVVGVSSNLSGEFVNIGEFLKKKGNNF